MTNSISVAEKNALSVSYDVLGSHVELDLPFVKKYLVRGRAELTSDQELVFFMNTCKMRGLNPLVNGEVYLIKYSKDDPAQMVIGKDAYLRRAFGNPDYLYKNDGITVLRGNEVLQKEGCCLYPGETLIGGWCRVFYKRDGKERTAFKEVALNEYNKGMANWKSKPSLMINKVAVSQCIREAFPKDYEGVYSEDEMVASGAVPADFKGVPTEPEQPADPPIDQEHRKMLLKFCRSEIGGADWQNVYTEILNDLGLESSDGMTMSQYERMENRIKEIAALRRAEAAEKEAQAETTAVEVPNEKQEPVEEKA